MQPTDGRAIFQVFLPTSQVLYMSALNDMTDVKPIIHFRPHLISLMAAMIRLRSSGRSCGRGGRKAESLTYRHKKNLCGIKVGELGGQRSSVWCAMDVNGLSAAGRLPCHAGRTHTAIMRYTKNKFGELLFPSAGCTLQLFPPLKCVDFMKCIREFRITLYVANTKVVPVK